MVTINEIRSKFLDFFEEHGHKKISSSSLIPTNDPSLIFVNAGMNQFKNIFTGIETSKYSRVTTSQKCVRAGGKHNDLNNVGYTTRHHTFFEMLGNFSFGNYFKEEAILLAWNLLTKEYCINKEKLLVTVYYDDDESINLWKKITGFSDNKIIRISTNDNFWTMGNIGPCGPCSEIFYDHGDNILGGVPGSKAKNNNRFVEIWNLVFMQYEKLNNGSCVNLPKPSIDTGMGLERLAALLQGNNDNYHTDIMKFLISASAEISGVDEKGFYNISHRIIADHLRSISFLIADGALPSNEGRGYVLRRIMRRAMLHVEIMGVKDPMIYKLLPFLITKMGKTFPEIIYAKELISKTIKSEEIRFKKTLNKGLHILEAEISNLNKGDKLKGNIAFKLYSTYGFPFDLTVDVLKKRNLLVNKEEFDSSMKRQQVKDRINWNGLGDVEEESIWFNIKKKIGPTKFFGYSFQEIKGKVLVLLKNKILVDKAYKNDKIIIILDKTVFYAESGGQIGDCGIFENNNVKIKITNVLKKVDNLFIHYAEIIDGELLINDILTLKVDTIYRHLICINHSATHLLHQTLRNKLGRHVIQKGSLVSDKYLRFDFSHIESISDKELSNIEFYINKYITQNSVVITNIMTKNNAVKLGAIALFDKKYDDNVVRVVSMGRYINNNKIYSIELCGGTHVKQTGDIGLFKIISETSIASGIRRIEALTGDKAQIYVNEEEKQIKSISNALRINPKQISKRVIELITERKKIYEELIYVKRQIIVNYNKKIKQNIEVINGISFDSRIINGISTKDLRNIVNEIRIKYNSAIVVIIGISKKGKIGISIGITLNLINKFNAIDIVKVASTVLGGKGGGGKKDIAQAGGVDSTKSDEAIAAIREIIIKYF